MAEKMAVKKEGVGGVSHTLVDGILTITVDTNFVGKRGVDAKGNINKTMTIATSHGKVQLPDSMFYAVNLNQYVYTE